MANALIREKDYAKKVVPCNHNYVKLMRHPPVKRPIFPHRSVVICERPMRNGIGGKNCLISMNRQC